MSAFLRRMFVPVIQKQHLGASEFTLSFFAVLMMRRRGKTSSGSIQIIQITLSFRSGRLLVCKQAWRSNNSDVAASMHWQNSVFLSERKEENFSSCPSSFYIPNAPIREKKTNVKILCLPTGHGNVTPMPLYFPALLCLTHSPHHAPPLLVMSLSFIFTIVVLLHLRPLPLSRLLSLQCRSPHSACLQAVFLIFLNYSRHFLLLFFFFFNPLINWTNPKQSNWGGEKNGKNWHLLLICIEIICLRRGLSDCSHIPSYSY